MYLKNRFSVKNDQLKKSPSQCVQREGTKNSRKMVNDHDEFLTQDKGCKSGMKKVKGKTGYLILAQDDIAISLPRKIVDEEDDSPFMMMEFPVRRSEGHDSGKEKTGGKSEQNSRPQRNIVSVSLPRKIVDEEDEPTFMMLEFANEKKQA